MHVARNAVLCVPSALVGNGSTFLGLPEGQNMVTLYGGTSVKYYLKYKAQSEAKSLVSRLAVMGLFITAGDDGGFGDPQDI